MDFIQNMRFLSKTRKFLLSVFYFINGEEKLRMQRIRAYLYFYNDFIRRYNSLREDHENDEIWEQMLAYNKIMINQLHIAEDLMPEEMVPDDKIRIFDELTRIILFIEEHKVDQKLYYILTYKEIIKDLIHKYGKCEEIYKLLIRLELMGFNKEVEKYRLTIDNQ